MTGVQTCALPISGGAFHSASAANPESRPRQSKAWSEIAPRAAETTAEEACTKACRTCIAEAVSLVENLIRQQLPIVALIHELMTGLREPSGDRRSLPDPRRQLSLIQFVRFTNVEPASLLARSSTRYGLQQRSLKKCDLHIVGKDME